VDELLLARSPLGQVSPGAPPYLLIHGDADRQVPIEHSIKFQNGLQRAGVRSTLFTIPGGSHGIRGWKALDGARNWEERMIEWLNSVLKVSGRQ
jgi:dipeptidyl aminopeptidase/acylaminoacyl peptidase